MVIIGDNKYKLGGIKVKTFDGYKKGVNLGGWLSQCGNNYNENHYRNFITEPDIRKIASWGCDHVRLPVDYNVIQTEDGEFIERGFEHIDNCIAWCKKNNLKMVLDLHKAKGYVFDDAEYVGFFKDKGLQDQFVSLWLEIIRRYGEHKDMMAFELLNEVTERDFAEPWNDIYERTIREIRTINKDCTLIVGGVFNSSIFGLTLMRKPIDPNVVYTVHCYSPLIFTHQSAYWIATMPQDYKLSYPGKVEDYAAESRKVFGSDFDEEFVDLNDDTMSSDFFDHLFKIARDKAEEFDVALYCGEYGVIDQTNPEDQLAWYKDINAMFEKYNMPRTAWSYKQMDFGLSDERLSGILPELVKYL